MANTAIDICSKALLLIGAEAIQSFEDETKESKVCSTIYETVRDTLLSNRLWTFSIEQLNLARLNETPLRDWKYVYALPTGVIRIGRVSQSKTFELMNGKLYSNDPAVSINCQKAVDVSEMPPYFQTALISEIAAKLCIALMGDTSKYQFFAQLAHRDLVNARLADSQNRPNIKFGEDSFWITVARA
jgi:hypothetical protein